MAASTSVFAVEIQYWQYVFDARVKAMDQLIANFEKANPDITVNQTTFPYADYQTKVAAAITAGQGPDVVQFYYGWLDNFKTGKLIQPLPQDAFPARRDREGILPDHLGDEGGRRILGPADRGALAGALLQQEDLPGGRPRSQQAADDARRAGRRRGQDRQARRRRQHHLGRHCGRHGRRRTTSGGARCSSASSAACPTPTTTRKVAYDDEHGLAALKWYTDLTTVHKVGQSGFMDEAQAAFKGGRAAMVIDGSFRLGSFSADQGLRVGRRRAARRRTASRATTSATGSTASPPTPAARSSRRPRSS